MRNLLVELILLFMAAPVSTGTLGNTTDSPASVSGPGVDHVTESTIKSRRKRYISQSDMLAIVDYHNQVRARVFPPAANMEHMVWDESLARSAESWAATCIWDHGPPYLLRYLGQNLSVRTGNYRSILQLVKPWYDEVKDYVFPYHVNATPCAPCAVMDPCAHITHRWFGGQPTEWVVQFRCVTTWWCGGSVWRQATYLVCDYSPKGNWIGEAPYKVGVPCSACPPSYGGSCRNNMCFPSANSNFMYWFK